MALVLSDGRTFKSSSVQCGAYQATYTYVIATWERIARARVGTRT